VPIIVDLYILIRIIDNRVS